MIKTILLLSTSYALASAWFMPTMSFGYGSDDESTTHVDKDFVRDDARGVVINNKQAKIYYDGQPVQKMHFYEAWDYCQNLEYAGLNEWRVINKEEGRDLLELSRRTIMVKHAFKNAQEATYWTSTQDRFDNAWYVDFDLGRYSTQKQKTKSNVICVHEDKK